MRFHIHTHVKQMRKDVQNIDMMILSGCVVDASPMRCCVIITHPICTAGTDSAATACQSGSMQGVQRRAFR